LVIIHLISYDLLTILFEGGLFPGLVLYLSGFYPRKILQLRIAIFFASASLSGAFSGLLAAAIINMDGIKGKPGWSWIFILVSQALYTLLPQIKLTLPLSPGRTIHIPLRSFFVFPHSPITV